MRPLALLCLAAALALLASPMMAPAASADSGTPIPGNVQYSVYRAWNDVYSNAGYLDFDAHLEDCVDNGYVRVEGRIQSITYPRPYPNGIHAEHLPAEAGISASFDACYLDENLSLVRETYTPTGVQAQPWGQLQRNLIGHDWLSDRAGSFWYENITISLYVGGEPVKIGEWQANAAYCEVVFLISEYAFITSPAWRITDPWNHPSTTNFAWQGVMIAEEWKSAPVTHFDQVIESDTARHDLILAARYADTAENRSALYGYLRSWESRLMSLYTWQMAITSDAFVGDGYPGIINPLVNGTADLAEGVGRTIRALQAAAQTRAGIRDGLSMDAARASLGAIMSDYHQAILYTDRALIKDATTQLDPFYGSQEEFRELFISTEITPYIDDPAAGGSFMAWIMSSEGMVLLGAAGALVAVAVIWRNGLAAVLALGVLALSAYMWMRGG